ncbi:F-box protein CPR1-like [Silene latifolia]|uniref:F-box protein CPR1-like n=1 Tax=Silene latifolia TaxID=37657 RepID=UPI003D7762C1
MANTTSTKNPKIVNQGRNIPIDLLETEILPRLPIQSLLRLKLVSKQWLATISSPQFTELMHLHRSISSQRGTFLLESSNGTLYFLDQAIMLGSNSKDAVIRRELNPYHGPNGQEIRLIDSSNGLICLAIDNDKFCLFNPATRVCREEIFPIKWGEKFYFYLWAFGYSTTRDEYKLLYVDRLSHLPKAHVYTLRSSDDLHNWRDLSVEDALRPYCFYSQSVGNFINEKVHWILRRQKTKRYKGGLCILAFDLTSETFNEISLPRFCRGNFFICDIDQNLSVCHQLQEDNSCYLEVWMMKRYGVSQSWSRIYNFDLRQNPVTDQLTNMIMSSNSCDITSEGGKLFFAVSDTEVLLVKDLNVRQPSYFKVLLDNNYAVRSIRRHVNSFVSPFLC